MKTLTWFKAALASDIPLNGGACIKYKEIQIAIFYSEDQKKFYACQNLCPHKKQMVLSRGIIGDKGGEPKVACPLHKKSFSLISGKNLNNEDFQIKTYPVRLEEGYVYIEIEE